MNYKINSNLFIEDELKQYVDFVDDDTKRIPANIIILKDKEEALKVTKPFLDDLSFHLLRKQDDQMKGNLNCCLTEKNKYEDFKIFLYEWNFPQTPYGKLEMLYVLFHELRHVYQKIFYTEHCLKTAYVSEGEGYKKQWVEIDANYYATQIIKKNRLRICEMLGYTNWKLTEVENPGPPPLN